MRPHSSRPAPCIHLRAGESTLCISAGLRYLPDLASAVDPGNGPGRAADRGMARPACCKRMRTGDAVLLKSHDTRIFAGQLKIVKSAQAVIADCSGRHSVRATISCRQHARGSTAKAACGLAHT